MDFVHYLQHRSSTFFFFFHPIHSLSLCCHGAMQTMESTNSFHLNCSIHQNHRQSYCSSHWVSTLSSILLIGTRSCLQINFIMFPDVPALSAIFVLPCIPTSNHYVIILVIIIEIIRCLTAKKMLIIPPNA